MSRLNDEREFPGQGMSARHLLLAADPHPQNRDAGIETPFSPSPRPGAGRRGCVSGLGLGQPWVGRGARRLSSCRGDAVPRLLYTDASVIAPPRRDRGPQDCGRCAWEKKERAPRGQLTSRRTQRPPAGRARTPAPAPGADPCPEARPEGAVRLRAGTRLGCRERRRGALASSAPPGSCGGRGCCCHPRREPRGAQREQVCGAAPGAPPAPSRRGRYCRGSRAACREGRGARVRSTRRPPGPRPGRGVRAPGPSAGSSRAGALRARQRLLGAGQAGRAPGWEERCKPGLGEESRVLSRKG